MTLREYLSILPEYDEATGTDIPRRWWNWSYEWHGPRLRLIVGDICADAEHEGGEPMGFSLGGELALFENIGQFDGWFQGEFREPKRHFEDHSATAIVGRWGIYAALRGREIR